jgi:hypothetical protein
VKARYGDREIRREGDRKADGGDKEKRRRLGQDEEIRES